jgi:hypothetical protein
MAKMYENYEWVDVESYLPARTGGLHGKVHVRPLPGQRFSVHLHVQCSRSITENYPVGTRFRLLAKLTDKEGGGEFLYSSYRWKYEVLWRPDHPD